MTAEPADQIARELRHRGLTVPALLLLDAHRPLRPLLGLAATFLFPIARPLLGGSAEHIRDALDRDEAYEGLVERLRHEAED